MSIIVTRIFILLRFFAIILLIIVAFIPITSIIFTLDRKGENAAVFALLVKQTWS